jgi:hypothetical protein
LNLGYEGANFALLREILTSARIAVKEETSYDNWNGGTYGHDVILFLPPETMAKIAFPKHLFGGQDTSACSSATAMPRKLKRSS